MLSEGYTSRQDGVPCTRGYSRWSAVGLADLSLSLLHVLGNTASMPWGLMSSKEAAASITTVSRITMPALYGFSQLQYSYRIINITFVSIWCFFFSVFESPHQNREMKTECNLIRCVFVGGFSKERNNVHIFIIAKALSMLFVWDTSGPTIQHLYSTGSNPSKCSTKCNEFSHMAWHKITIIQIPVCSFLNTMIVLFTMNINC